jgi:hypothetical protein
MFAYGFCSLIIEIINLCDYLRMETRSFQVLYILHFVHIACDFSSIALPVHSGPWPLIQFRNHFLQTVGSLGRVINRR